MNLPLRVALYRYVFFGWLFRDLSRQSDVYAFAAALRHNREQSRWVPVYLRRYAMFGVILGGFGFAIESWSAFVSAFFYVPGTLTVPMLAVTAIAWTGLRFTE